MNHVCFDLSRCFCWFPGLNWSKISKKGDLAPKFQKSNLGALILCWLRHFNDSRRSYMMESDLPVCVLICLDVYLGLQEIKLVTNKQKIADFIPKNPTLLPWYCAETQNLLFFSYLWQSFASSDQDKHLNRSKHTLADQFPSYMTLRESLGMP